jgi:hypothetical protein
MNPSNALAAEPLALLAAFPAFASGALAVIDDGIRRQPK